MNAALVDNIVSTLKDILNRDAFTPLHEPHFAGNEWAYVKETLDSGWVSSVGKYVDEFEQRLQETTGAKRAIAVSSGTGALHVALLLAGVERDCEVIMPSMTFAATAAAAAYLGAIPHFADIEAQTFGINPDKLEDHLNEIAEKRGSKVINKNTGRRIAAIVPMHTFGHPVRLDELCELAKRWSIPLVEDSAESLGSYYKGRHTGTFGDLGILSFNGNKTITTGGGGAILTNNCELADKAKHLTTTAKLPHKWEYVHDMVGYNYRMPNINAALGCAQLEQLPSFLESKRKLAQKYSEKLKSCERISFVTEPQDCKSNYWLNAISLDSSDMELRNAILEKTNAEGIMTRPVWKLMNTLPAYQNSPRMDLAVSEEYEAKLINIPSGVGLD